MTTPPAGDLLTDWPIRKKRVHGVPQAPAGWRGCQRCGADHWTLAPGSTGERGIWGGPSGWQWWCSLECAPTSEHPKEPTHE